MNNAQVAEALEEIADLLDFTGANPFRVRAYRNGARAVRDLAEHVSVLAGEGKAQLQQIPGIGADLADKIIGLVETQEIPLLNELRAQIPASVLALLRVPGLGSKKAAVLHKELAITNLADLKDACEAGRVRVLKGFGAKTEQTILAGLEIAGAAEERLLWADADVFAQELLAWLQADPTVEQIEAAGSYRRGRETVGDLDLLVVSQQPPQVMDRLALQQSVAQVLARGDTKMSVRLRNGLQVDLRVVPAESFGAALQYFTGSKEHNVEIRSRAKACGLKINEYGVYRDDVYLAGRTEADVYSTLALPWFPPELREARREFEWAAGPGLPRLITVNDLRGDLHMHTTATDGQATLREMVAAAAARGLEYIAITDHSKRVSMANGLDGPRLREQWAAIDALNRSGEFPTLTVLKGVEVDILERGGLDLPDDVLAEADWVVASIHYGQNQPRVQIMARLFDALRSPHVSAIAHPTGRLINRRQPYDVDLPELIRGAAEHGKLLELNANPMRLDLDDTACAAARDQGVPIVISTDAHSVDGLLKMRYGVLQARRAGLTPQAVANTRGWNELKGLIGRASTA